MATATAQKPAELPAGPVVDIKPQWATSRLNFMMTPPGIVTIF